MREAFQFKHTREEDLRIINHSQAKAIMVNEQSVCIFGHQINRAD
jgi:hypothetical protein